MQANILFDISHLRFERKVICNINDDLFLLTNDNDLRDNFFTQSYFDSFGKSDTRYVPESVYGYSTVTLHDTDKKLHAEIKIKFEDLFMERQQYVQALLTFLWFVKDNSVGLYSTMTQIPSINLPHKLSESFSYWNSEGRRESNEFSESEIQEAAALTVKYQEICPRRLRRMSEMILPYEIDQNGLPFRTSLQRAEKSFNYNNQNCIERAFNFLIIARSQPIVIYKIAYYMAAFESLFTTNSSEITTRMAYRVAFYIGESLEECREIFNTIHQSYDIRSKFLHGQKFDKDTDIEQSHLITRSKQIDKILRRCFKKVILQDSDIFVNYDNKSRDSYLSNLVFGLPFDHEAIKQNIKKSSEHRMQQEEKVRLKKEKGERQNKKS